jgi:cytochrome c553
LTWVSRMFGSRAASESPKGADTTYGLPSPCWRRYLVGKHENLKKVGQSIVYLLEERMNKAFGMCILLAMTPLVQAADIEAGKARAVTVCAACHGANGLSVRDVIPNLAGQHARYLETQLRAFKEGARKAPTPTSGAAMMTAIAAQLSADDIANVAAYFAAQPASAQGARSAPLPNIAKSQVVFPESYRESFVRYLTQNEVARSVAATSQVRYYYANPAAVAAAKAGKPLPDGSMLLVEVHAARLGADGKPVVGADGFFVPEKLVQYNAMARDAGWGDELPEMLRNENWNYAIFSSDRQRRRGVNQAECLACHKPLDRASYTFTLKQLADVK